MRSDIDWIRWGKRDPLWAVAAWEGKQSAGPNPWTDEEFYATGDSDWSACERAFKRYGVDLSGCCLEIGCGAGRMTWPLARSFGRVVAVDVSPEMLAYAGRNRRADNVELHLTSGAQLPVGDGSIAAVFSTYVFQHFDHPRDGLAYFRELHRALAPNAAVMIHLPLYRWPEAPNAGAIERLQRTAFETTRRLRWAASRALAALRRFRGSAVMRGIAYDADRLSRALEGMGYTQVECVLRGPLGRSWVFARKAG